MKHESNHMLVTMLGTVLLGLFGILAAVNVPPIQRLMVQVAAAPAEQGDLTCATYTSTDVPIAIPDANTTGAFSELKINALGYIRFLTVTVSFTHDAPGDIVTYFCRTDNCMPVLTQSWYSSGESFTTSFTDNLGVTTSTAYHGQTKGPRQFMNAGGFPIGGTWKVRFVDRYATNTGSITGWSMTACTTPTRSTPTPLPTIVTYTPGPTVGNSCWEKIKVYSVNEDEWYHDPPLTFVPKYALNQTCTPGPGLTPEGSFSTFGGEIEQLREAYSPGAWEEVRYYCRAAGFSGGDLTIYSDQEETSNNGAMYNYTFSQANFAARTPAAWPIPTTYSSFASSSGYCCCSETCIGDDYVPWFIHNGAVSYTGPLYQSGHDNINALMDQGIISAEEIAGACGECYVPPYRRWNSRVSLDCWTATPQPTPTRPGYSTVVCWTPTPAAGWWTWW